MIVKHRATVKHVLDQSTRMLTLLYLQVRKLISYVYAFVTDFSVRRIHNNKITFFISTYGTYLEERKPNNKNSKCQVGFPTKITYIFYGKLKIRNRVLMNAINLFNS